MRDGGVALAEAKNQFSALTAEANRTGRPFTVLKNNKPWVEIRPLAVEFDSRPDAIHITPVHRRVEVADLDELFHDFEGDFVPVEDGLATAVGWEAL